VGEGDLSRAGRASSPQQTGRGDRRVRRPERPAEERAGPGWFPGRPVDARRVEGLRRREVREDTGDLFNLIFPVYLKLMTDFHPFSQKRKIISNKGQKTVTGVGW
jgi:hypothetical protein